MKAFQLLVSEMVINQAIKIQTKLRWLICLFWGKDLIRQKPVPCSEMPFYHSQFPRSLGSALPIYKAVKIQAMVLSGLWHPHVPAHMCWLTAVGFGLI